MPAAEDPRLVVRRREPGDLPALDGLVRRAHAERGYPGALPDDPGGWLIGTTARAPFSDSFVAELAGAVAGHVATASALEDRAATVWSEALGVEAETLSVVKRLVVDPCLEGRGIGRRLLERAVAVAHERGLWPVLDTVEAPSRAVAFYERAGWRSVGRVVVPAGHAGWRRQAVLACFVGPPPPGLG
jgi:GNAT superfamily N-acetyltransferase